MLIIIIIVVIAIHTLSAGFLLASADRYQMLSSDNLWNKNLDSIVCTHTQTHANTHKHTYLQKKIMHTDDIYLFIYHVRMHLLTCVCVNLNTDCTAKRGGIYEHYFKK